MDITIPLYLFIFRITSFFHLTPEIFCKIDKEQMSSSSSTSQATDDGLGAGYVILIVFCIIIFIIGVVMYNLGTFAILYFVLLYFNQLNQPFFLLLIY